MTFAILTDSTADLDQNWAKEHQVTILGLTIELDGTVYQTVGEGQLTSPELLEAMKWSQTDNQSGQCGPISGDL